MTGSFFEVYTKVGRMGATVADSFFGRLRRHRLGGRSFHPPPTVRLSKH
jgi:hypothetical protein